MSKVFVLLTFFLTIATLPKQLFADAPIASAPYVLAYKFVVGQTHKYATTMDMSEQITMGTTAQPINMHMESTSSQTVQSIRPSDGAAIEQVSITLGNSTMNGQPMPTAALQAKMPASTTVAVSPSGQTTMITSPTSGSSGSTQGFTSPFSSFGMAAFLPTKPVNIGDSWTATIPVAMLNTDVVAHMTLKSVQVINGDNVATIQSDISTDPTATSPTQSTMPFKVNTNISGQTTSEFDIDSGYAISTSGKMYADISPAAPAAGAPATPQMHVQSVIKVSVSLIP